MLAGRVTATLALMLLLGTGLAPSVAYLCRMTGEVSTRCCCDTDAPEADVLREDAKC